MVDKAGIYKRKIKIRDGVFKIETLYKEIKKKSDSLGYLFVEKEHANKPTKYGGELKFQFTMIKEIDYFAMAEINVIILFENIKKAKGYDVGDIELEIKSDQILDHKNRWGKNKFNQFLFKLYLKINKEKFKNKYLIPIIIDSNEIYNNIKELIEEYG